MATKSSHSFFDFPHPYIRQSCDPSNLFGANCDTSGSAIAVGRLQALCAQVVNTCPGGFPAAVSCIGAWCQMGCTDPDKCCSSSDPQSCFQNSFGSTGSSSAEFDNEPGISTSLDSNSEMENEPATHPILNNAAPTIAPTSTTSGNYNITIASGPSLDPTAACKPYIQRLASCAEATPEHQLPLSDRASCYCFESDGSYNGKQADGIAFGCYQNMLSQTLSDEASAFSQNAVDLCTRFVDAGVISSVGLLGGTSNVTATRTAPYNNMTTAASSARASSEPPNACNTAVPYLKSCEAKISATPTVLKPDCYCFNNNGTYRGQFWDDTAGKCYKIMQSRNSLPASDISTFSSDVVDLCTKSVDPRLMTKGLDKSGGASKTTMVGSKGSGDSSPTGGAAVTSTVIASPINAASSGAGWAGIMSHSAIAALIITSLSGFMSL